MGSKRPKITFAFFNRYGILKWFKRIIGCIVFVLLLCLSTVVIVLNTASGTAWLFQKILPEFGVRVVQVEGTLWKGLTLGELHWQQDGLSLELKHFKVRISPGALLFGELHIKNMEVDQVQLHLPPSTSDNTSSQAEFRLPSLPLSLVVNDLYLHQAEIDLGEQSISLKQVRIDHFQWTPNVLRWEMPSFYADSEQWSVGLTSFAQTHLTNMGQMRDVHIQLKILPESDYLDLPLSGQIVLKADRLLNLSQLSIQESDTVLNLGNNHLIIQGALAQADSQMNIVVNFYDLADFLPSLPGSIQLTTQIQGAAANHRVVSKGALRMPGQPVAVFSGDMQGGWQLDDVQGTQRYQGVLNHVKFDFKKIHVSSVDTLKTIFEIDSQGQIVLNIDQTVLDTQVGNYHTPIELAYMRIKDGRIEAKGGFKQAHISPDIIRYIRESFTHHQADESLLTHEHIVMEADWFLDLGKQIDVWFKLKRIDGKGAWPFQYGAVAMDFDQANFLIKSSDQKQFQLEMKASGEQSKLDMKTTLDTAFIQPLRRLYMDMRLRDQSYLNMDLAVSTETSGIEAVKAILKSQNFRLESMSLGFLPTSLLSADIDARLRYRGKYLPESLSLKGKIDPHSQWQQGALSGDFDFSLSLGGDDKNLLLKLRELVIQSGYIRLKIGDAFIDLNSKIASQDKKGEIRFDARIPDATQLWHSFSGNLIAHAQFNGNFAQHDLLIDATSSLLNKNFALKLKATDHFVPDEQWKMSIHDLQAKYSGFQLQALDAQAQWLLNQANTAWNVNLDGLHIRLPDEQTVVFETLNAQGNMRSWQTKGHLQSLRLSDALINRLIKDFRTDYVAQTGNLNIHTGQTQRGIDLLLGATWDLQYQQRLQGAIQIKRLGGDLVTLSHEPLEVETLQLDVTIKPQGRTKSLVKTEVQLKTARNGHIKGMMHFPIQYLEPKLFPGLNLAVYGELPEIAWLSPLTNNLLELGGRLKFALSGASLKDHGWLTNGYIVGKQLKAIQVENGIRLLDGSIEAYLQNNQLHLKQLYFPAQIRLQPALWRTRQWLDQTPEAQKGYLKLTGKWDVIHQKGQIQTEIQYYPIVQRSDRFVMVSGQLNLDAALPKVVVHGHSLVNAGWASIDMLGEVPSLDSDVDIVLTTQPNERASSPLNIDASFNLDMGSAFYVVGLGLDTRIQGSLDITQKEGLLKGVGSFQTVNGRLNVYGQNLSIDRGLVTFQGNINNPVLDILALRTNAEVRAGLAIKGTAQKPIVSLVSTPEVSEIEKLSWLILGRSPNSDSSDLALLLSVGTSFLNGDGTKAPFYRRIGLDELNLLSGQVGQSVSLLPSQTVASGSYTASDEDTSGRYIMASKVLTERFKIGIEQAIDRAGTVFQASYALIQNMTVNVSVGTVNGLELVYKHVFDVHK